MSSPPANFIERAHWARVLERLNVPPATDALPLTTTCPTCRQPQLTCYEDALTEGQWFYCPVCKRGGDPIQLAAETWGVTIEAAIIKLRHSGLPLVDGRYQGGVADIKVLG